LLVPNACSAGLKSTDFVLFNTRVPQAIGFVVFFRVEEYIASGRDKFKVDPDPKKIYTKRKARECSISLPDSSSQNNAGTRVKYPTIGWGEALEKLPLFTSPK